MPGLVKDALSYLITILYFLVCSFTYFVFVSLLCIQQNDFNDTRILLFFVTFQVLLGCSVVFYLRIQSVGDISTLDIFQKSSEKMEIEEDYKNCNPFFAEEFEKENLIKRKVCRLCDTYKPPRSHHCSVCNCCFLKLDHHCYLFGSCIGFQKYKIFVQFLIYNLFFMGYTLAVLVCEIDYKNVDVSFNVFYTINVIVLGISLIYNLLTLINHCLLISLNETTIENSALNTYFKGDNSYNHIFQEGPIAEGKKLRDRKTCNPYNMGLKRNWIEVFGQNISDWFLPTISSRGDGTNFPINAYSENLHCGGSI